MDLRTPEGRLLWRVRTDLAEYVGGKPDAVAKARIDQIAMLSLHIALMDRKALANRGTLSPRDSRQYLAWCNSRDRLLQKLPAAPRAKRPSLADHLAGRGVEAPA